MRGGVSAHRHNACMPSRWAHPPSLPPCPPSAALTQAARHVLHLRDELRHIAHRVVQPLQAVGHLSAEEWGVGLVGDDGGG